MPIKVCTIYYERDAPDAELLYVARIGRWRAAALRNIAIAI